MSTYKRNIRPPLGAALVLSLLAPLACGRDDAPDPAVPEEAVTWERGQVRITTASGDSRIVDVEIAERDDQRAYGLMNRTSLPENAGMLFVYDQDQPAEGSFWMFNTRIPLDIAFLDAEGTIVSIRQMEPCTSPYPQWCPGYEAGAPFRMALEMNHGWFGRNQVGLGDRVELLR